MPDLTIETSPSIDAIDLVSELSEILHGNGLYPLFQPIVDLENGSIFAHESLIRGPRNSRLHTPDALLDEAHQEGQELLFEQKALESALLGWGHEKPGGRLFLNVSANALMQFSSEGYITKLLQEVIDCGIKPRLITFEITEHQRVMDMDALLSVVEEMRKSGFSFALDDFGDGKSSLRLWAQIKPEFVKVDKYFVHNIHVDPDRVNILKAMAHIASLFGTKLIAEGIEHQEELVVVRDLGISFGQGYLLGRPANVPIGAISTDLSDCINQSAVSIFQERERQADLVSLKGLNILRAPTVHGLHSNEDVAALFAADSNLHAIAYLDGRTAVGLIDRSKFYVEYSKPYFKEVWGKKPCTKVVNFEPRIVERRHSVNDLIGILTSEDQRYLTEGFIVTDDGAYYGLGRGEQLVRAVTETRIESARHANPLTGLPGNIPITHHIDRLIARKSTFAACYADLNFFKPFNDFYGYWRGDEMIRLLAQCAREQCDPKRDFLGHVGGDDFILIYQNTEWLEKCRQLIEDFNTRAQTLYGEAEREAGGLDIEDRHGVQRFFGGIRIFV